MLAQGERRGKSSLKVGEKERARWWRTRMSQQEGNLVIFLFSVILVSCILTYIYIYIYIYIVLLESQN